MALTNPSAGAALGSLNVAEVRIDDDVGTIEFAAPLYVVSEAAGNARILVHRFGRTNESASVEFSSQSETAAVGIGSKALRATLAFLPGETAKALDLPIQDDRLAEPDEIVELSLGSPAGVAIPFRRIAARLRIADDERTGGLDSGFAPQLGPVGDLRCVTLQGDGRIVIGGVIYTNDGWQPLLIRLDPGGPPDESFRPVLRPQLGVDAVVVQPDGRLVIGLGSWTSAMVVRLQGDGSEDSTFQPRDFRCSAPSTRLALQSDGRILAAVGDEIVRLNADGSDDASFQRFSGDKVSALAVLPNGKILVGGPSPIVLDQGVIRLPARLNPNGSLDTEFNPPGDLGRVYALAVQADGRILVGYNAGNWIEYRVGLRRLLPDGGWDASFKSVTNVAGRLTALALQRDGKVLAGGAFGPLAPGFAGNIARLTADGSLDASFDAGPGPDRTW